MTDAEQFVSSLKFFWCFILHQDLKDFGSMNGRELFGIMNAFKEFIDSIFGGIKGSKQYKAVSSHFLQKMEDDKRSGVLKKDIPSNCKRSYNI